MVDKKNILDNKTMREGDVVIALPSSGVHSNGFSLVRKVFDIEHCDLKSPREELNGEIPRRGFARADENLCEAYACPV